MGRDGTWEPVPSQGRGESTGCVYQVSLLIRKQLGQETRYKRGSLQESRLEGLVSDSDKGRPAGLNQFPAPILGTGSQGESLPLAPPTPILWTRPEGG